MKLLMEEAQTFMIKLVPPRRRSVTHQQAYERMHRFLTFASRADIDAALQDIRPHKRVRWLVDKFEEETNEHIPISKIYKVLRENNNLTLCNGDRGKDTDAPAPKQSEPITTTINEQPTVIKFDEE